MAYSRNGGGPSVLGGGPCPGLSVDLSNPIQIVGVVPADGSGNAKIDVAIPPLASGIQVWIQAVDLNTCQKSNQVVQVIA